MNIVQVTLNDLDTIVELFDQYRKFYGQPSDKEGASQFIKERISNNESVIFLASENGQVVGFTQLYPMFSSVSMRRTLVLNDLFVVESARRLGAGKALIERSFAYGREIGAKGISLETGNDNVNAQNLYEKIGFTREENYFYYYSL